MLYEVLLPHLCGTLVYTAVSKRLEDNGHWETIQRSGTCFMRSILTCLRFLLKRAGLSHIQQKQLFVALRLKLLDIVDDNLQRKHLGPDSAHLINESDIKLIEIACNQTARSATKLVAYEDRLRIQLAAGAAARTANNGLGNGGAVDVAVDQALAAERAALEAAARAAVVEGGTAAAAAAAAADASVPGRVWAARQDLGSLASLQVTSLASNGRGSGGCGSGVLSPEHLARLESLISRVLAKARATLAAVQFRIDRVDALQLVRLAFEPSCFASS
jgi:hypothetical protein